MQSLDFGERHVDLAARLRFEGHVLAFVVGVAQGAADGGELFAGLAHDHVAIALLAAEHLLPFLVQTRIVGFMKDIGDRGNRQGNFLPAQKRQLDFFALKDNGLASKLAAVIEFDFTELGIRLGSRGLKAEVQDLGNRSDDFLLLDLEDDFLVGEADEVTGI